MLSHMRLPTLTVRRAEFSVEDPWALPDGGEWIPMRRSTDGSQPRLPTQFAVYADSGCLNVLFHAQDDDVVATYLGHDQPLYQEDVVEVFLAPRDVTRYYEIEVNPLGTTFDARVDSPEGVRATMKIDVGWDCAGLFAAVKKVEDVVDTIVRIPFDSIDTRPPAPGTEWRGNFFRIDRSRSHGDEFSAWQPTMKNPPDFHVAAAFGRIVFA
jgi:hypothetical protein